MKDDLVQEHLKLLDEITDRQIKLLVVLEADLKRLDRLLEIGAEIVGLFSQKMLEKGIEDAMRELEGREKRKRYVKKMQKERWRRKHDGQV